MPALNRPTFLVGWEHLGLALLALMGVACSHPAVQSSSGSSSGSGVSSSSSGVTSSSSSSAAATSSTGGTTGVGPPGAGSVLMHHLHPNRDGNYVDGLMTRAYAANMHIDQAFFGLVDGNVYAQPLYIDQSADGSGDLVIVATEMNVIYALAADGGRTVWRTQLGEPVPLDECGGGNIDPLGITGTPFIDLDAGALYVDSLQIVDGGYLPDGDVIQSNRIYALSIADGSVLPGWPVDVAATVDFDGGGFIDEFQQNRGAVLAQDGILYVPFGGRAGDVGDYHGAVVGVPVHNPQAATAWSTVGAGGAVWGMSGVTSDGTNLWVSTGNGKEGASGAWAGSSGVFRLTAGPLWSGAVTDYWASPQFHHLDDGDYDLSGTGTQVFDFPPGTSNPAQVVTLFGKDGNLYLLDRTNLGGIVSPPLMQQVSSGQIRTAPARISVPGGMLIAYQGTPSSCPPGQETGDLTAILIAPGSPPSATVAWCAYQDGQGSTIISTIDGVNEGLVWGIGAEGDNRLKAFDLASGRPIYTGGGPLDAMGLVQHYNAPIIAKGRVYVGGNGQLYAFTSD